jgi:fructokinase
MDLPQRSRARLDRAMTKPEGRPVAGIELGGTKCICILADSPDTIRAQQAIPTTTPEETLAGIEAVLDGWRDEYGFAALGIASFGPVELRPGAAHYGYITQTTKPGWAHTDVGPRLTRRYGVPAAIDTDVSGAALAEGQWGRAQGLDTFTYITVGTGIGAGIIAHGRPVLGLGHAEAGHMKVGRHPGDTWPGACTFHGDCAEGLASGFAIEQRVGHPLDRLAPDDPVWRLVAHTIAGLCRNLVMTVVPQRILIGGGVANRQPQLLPLVRTMLVEALAGYGQAAEIEAEIADFIGAPGLGDRAGPLGAIALAHHALATGGDPLNA